MTPEAAAQELVTCLNKKQYSLALAESCTAGLVADLIARVSGASSVFWGSFVCYTPDAKERMLGIESGFLKTFGLVSRETAREMARHALSRACVMISAAVTGLAGPQGDGSDTPVGTVWVATARRENDGTVTTGEKELHFLGTRAEVRTQAAAAVLNELLKVLDQNT